MSLTKVTYSMITGAVANILDFGADPTGVADSTSAIQTAIDSTSCVFIPEGNFKITGLTINKNRFAMFGVGDNSVLTMTTDANVAINIGSTANAQEIDLKSFKLQGNSSNLGGISLGTATYYTAWVLLEELYIDGFRNAGTNTFGIKLRSVQELEVRNCIISNNYHGVQRLNEGYTTSTLFSGKKSYCGRNGIGFLINGPTDDITIRDYIIEGNSAEGINANNYKSNLFVSGCYFEENCSANTGLGAVYVTGNATAYNKSRLVLDRCSFHIMSAGSFPNIQTDQTIAYISGNDNALSSNTGVVTSANTSVVFAENKGSDAGDTIATLAAMSGQVGAIEIDANGIPFSFGKYAIYKAVTPLSGTPNNSTYVSTIDGKLYFRDGSGVDHALY